MAMSVLAGGDTGVREKNDFYPTPTCSVESLLKWFGDRKLGMILEPFAGNGNIVKVLEKSDLVDYTFASDKFVYNKVCETDIQELDFLDLKKEDYNFIDWVISNPPYDRTHLLSFIQKCLDVSTTGLALFLKGNFLETKTRMEFFKKNKMLKHVLIFANRQPLAKNGTPEKGYSNAIMYAWFVWEKDHNGLPQIDWIDNTNECRENKEKGVY